MAASLARLLRIPLQRAVVRVRGHFWREGSALAGDLEAGAKGLDVELEAEASPQEVARLVAMARSSCYVEQALARPVPVDVRVRLNGQELAAS